jgi:ribosomal RNA assembly protein
MIQSVKIPGERIGALIGKDGETKDRIEKKTGTKLSIDSKEGDVQIDSTRSEDPAIGLSVLNVVTAIGRGFSPEKAMLLLDENYMLEILDIRDFVGKKQEHVMRVRARVIGSHGKTRAIIEELTGAFISVYGNTVSVIASGIQMNVALRALDMLLSGSEHAAVYQFLEKMRPQLKVDGMGF